MFTAPKLAFYEQFVRIFGWFAFSLIAKSAFRYYTIHFLLIDLNYSLNCMQLKALRSTAAFKQRMLGSVSCMPKPPTPSPYADVGIVIVELQPLSCLGCNWLTAMETAKRGVNGKLTAGCG